MEFTRFNKLFASEYYAVPDYQRDYEWSNAQNTVLCDDIFSLLEDEENTNHFIGAIVTVPFERDNAFNSTINFTSYDIDSDSSVRHVVDGQQRLTSLSIFVCALRDYIQQNDLIETTEKKRIIRTIDAVVLGKNFDLNSRPCPTLILNGNTGHCYNNRILKASDTAYDGRFVGAKRLISAYELFSKQIKDRRDEYKSAHPYKTDLDFVKAVLDVLYRRIIFVEIRCDASSNAFQVFDSLNGKGLDLTAADRIKNIVISWGPTSQNKISKWDSFVEETGDDYLVSFFVALFFYEKIKRISKNKLPDEFKSRYKDFATSDYDRFFDYLRKCGSIYGKIRKHSTGNEPLNNALEDLSSLGTEQAFVIIFASALHYDVELSSPSDEFVGFVKEVTRLIVRHQVCEKSMNRLDYQFAQWISDMKNGLPLVDITRRIHETTNSLIDDETFKTAFEKFAPSDRKVSEFYVRSLENYYRTKAGRRNEDVKRGLTIEHIIPQTLDDDELKGWFDGAEIPEEVEYDRKGSLIERIGNKALLYGDDNSSASNKTYSEKQEVYREGKRGQQEGTPVNTFALIANLLNDYPERFAFDEVSKRSKEFAEVAIELW